ncbi:MAG: hypothetical protein KAR40_16365 [Candidatus Sabulitectum sp.]|nr:hypothetical protein [Candidatus Sabulitectum sp.]
MKKIILTVTLLALSSIAFAVPSSISTKIKNKAKQDFPNDYSTQEYVIKNQEQAYSQIQNYSYSGVPSSVINKLKEKAENEYPIDFSTQKYVIDSQVESYKKVN